MIQKTRYTSFYKSLQYCIVGICLFISASGFAQNNIQLLGGKSIRKFAEGRIIVGDVKWAHKGAFLYCDSLVEYTEKQILKAYFNVKVEDDGATMYGDSLYYNSQTKLGWLIGHVRLNQDDQTLVTDRIDFDREIKLAEYHTGGVLTDISDSSRLTSVDGYYFYQNKEFAFAKDVEYTSPDLALTTDSLVYKENSDLIYFYGPTEITQDSAIINCKKGWYNSTTEDALFRIDAEVFSPQDSTTIWADKIKYNGTKEIAEAFNNVFLENLKDNMAISSEYLYSNNTDSLSIATGDMILMQFDNEDTLFTHGDSLYMFPDTLQTRSIRISHGVKIFKSDFQGVCDSLVYHEYDSSLTMFTNPLLWTEGNQIKGDTIIFYMIENKMDSMNVRKNALVISEADSIFYNQISGRNMTCFFNDSNQLDSIYVMGNSETIYFAQDEDSLFVGMNREKCANYVIHFLDNEVNTIFSMDQPEGDFYPMDKITPELMYFRRFKWYGDIRPMSKDDLLKD